MSSLLRSTPLFSSSSPTRIQSPMRARRQQPALTRRPGAACCRPGGTRGRRHPGASRDAAPRCPARAAWSLLPWPSPAGRSIRRSRLRAVAGQQLAQRIGLLRLAERGSVVSQRLVETVHEPVVETRYPGRGQPAQVRNRFRPCGIESRCHAQYFSNTMCPLRPTTSARVWCCRGEVRGGVQYARDRCPLGRRHARLRRLRHEVHGDRFALAVHEPQQ
jgi:hypothetical protein